MPAALAATVFVADRNPSQWVGPGLLGFVIIVGLCVGTYLLWRNMNKQLRKVNFDDGSDAKPKPNADADAKPASKDPKQD
jgi:hypothetical protein